MCRCEEGKCVRNRALKVEELVRDEAIKGCLSLIVEHRRSFYKRSLTAPVPLPQKNVLKADEFYAEF